MWKLMAASGAGTRRQPASVLRWQLGLLCLGSVAWAVCGLPAARAETAPPPAPRPPAPQYELRLVPFDDPAGSLEARVTEANASWAGVVQRLPESEREGFATPQACWAANILLNGKPVFEIYERDVFITRVPVARPDLKPGKYTIWPGDHAFTVAADGSVVPGSDQLSLTTETLPNGGQRHVLRLTCYPLTIRTRNIDSLAPPPVTLSDHIALPRLTLRDATDNARVQQAHAAAAAVGRGVPDDKVRELLPVQSAFRWLTVWLPANRVGRGYEIFPLQTTLHLAPAGVELGAADGLRQPGWEQTGFTVEIPVAKVSVQGQYENEFVVPDLLKERFSRQPNQPQPPIVRAFYSRRDPFEFRVSSEGPALLIDGDLRPYPHKRIVTDWADATHTAQRALLVEMRSRHAVAGRAVEIRWQAVDPFEAVQAAAARDGAQASAKRAADRVAQARADHAKAEQAAAKADHGPAETDALAAAAGALQQAEVAVVAATSGVARAGLALAAVADRNRLHDARPFARWQRQGDRAWHDLPCTAGPAGGLSIALPENTVGVYTLRVGVIPAAGLKQAELFVDQWITVAPESGHGIGLFTPRGRTAFLRGERVSLAVSVIPAGDGLPAGTPLSLRLTGDAAAGAPAGGAPPLLLYEDRLASVLTNRSTLVFEMAAATTLALAPGAYHIEAQLGERRSVPWRLDLVDPAPVTHFTKLLLGKYNGYADYYGAALHGEDPETAVRGMVESGYNAFQGMTYAMDRVNWAGAEVTELVRQRPVLGPVESFSIPSGRDRFLDAAVRHNLAFYENLFTQHDSMLPRGEMMLRACERYAALETQSMKHSPAFRGVCLYDELNHSLDHDTSADMMAYFLRADELDYRRKHGRGSVEALRARDRFFGLPEGQRRYADAARFRTWPLHLDDQWTVFSDRMSRAAKDAMPEARNFTLYRSSPNPGGLITWGVGTPESVLQPLDAVGVVGYKDMGGYGSWPLAAPFQADVLRVRDSLRVWPMLIGQGTGAHAECNLRDAFMTLSQKCDGFSFMHFESTPRPHPGDNYDAARAIAGTLATRYGDLFLALEKGYRKVAIHYSRELDVVASTRLMCEGLWVACLRAGFPADILTDSQIRADQGLAYDVIFVPGVQYKEAVPPETLAALQRLQAAGRHLATEQQSRLDLDGVLRLGCDLQELDDRSGGTFPKYLDHDDERWWDMTVQTTAAVKALLGPLVPPAAEHDLLLGPDWLQAGDARYLVVANHAWTGFRGDHKALYSAPAQPTLRLPRAMLDPARTPVCYDLLEMTQIPLTDAGGAVALPVDFRFYPGKIYAFLPAATDAVALDVQTPAAPGAAVTYRVQVLDAAGRPLRAAVPLRIRVASGGRQFQELYRVANPDYAGSFAMPANLDAPLTIAVQELLGGRCAEATVQPVTAELPRAQLNRATALITDGERIRAFLAGCRDQAPPLFTATQIVDSVKLAARIVAGNDGPSALLRSRFSADGVAALTRQAADAEGLRATLTAELNRVVTGPRIYSAEVFPPTALPVEAARLGADATATALLPDVNRFLIETWFATEIRLSPPVLIGYEETRARPAADRLATAIAGQGLRVRVAPIGGYVQAPRNTVVGDTAGDLALDGLHLWRGERVQPGFLIDAPLIFLGGQSPLVTQLAARDLLVEPLSDNYPGPGRAIVTWINRAFSHRFDTVALLAADPAGLERAVDALLAPDASQAAAHAAHPTVTEPPVEPQAPRATTRGQQPEPWSFRDTLLSQDRVESLDVEAATGRVLVGTFGYSQNLFCFDANSNLLWKTFLPEHDVYLVKWLDGNRVLAATGQGFFAFLLDGRHGTVLRRFASTEWPDYHVEERETRTRIQVTLNPSLRQIMLLGRTGLLAVDYDGNRMWFHDRAREIVNYPEKMEQAGQAAFGEYLRIAAAVVAPDGARVAYNEMRIVGSYKDDFGLHMLWRNEPQILEARTGRVLLHNTADPGSNDPWTLTWPAGSDHPWIRASNLSAPLLFAEATPTNGAPNPGRLGAFVPPVLPALKSGGRLAKPVDGLRCFDADGRLLWQVQDEYCWVENLDTVNADDTRLFRCSRDGLVRCLDLADGRLLWQRQLDSSAMLKPLADGGLLAGGRNGWLRRFDAEGRPVWQQRLGDLFEPVATNYAGYVQAALRRDPDQTGAMYPVSRDGPDDFDGVLRLGIDQIANGGFEEAAGWTATPGPLQFDRRAQSGARSLALADGARATAAVTRRIIPSATYLLEFYYRTEDAATRLAAGAALHGARETLTASLFPARPGEWTFGRLAVKALGDTQSIAIGFESAGGTLLVDQVRFRPVRFPSSNLLANERLHQVEVTRPEDFRDIYNRIPGELRQSLLGANNVAAYLQAVPLGTLIFTEEQAFLQNGKLDDVGPMWCYKPEPIAFGVALARPSYVSHLVLYLNNATPETVYRQIAVLANDLEKKVPRTVALVRGNHKRFIVVHFPETLYTDSLKVLPGKHRAQTDSITEIEVYGPVGGPETLTGKKFSADPLAWPMFMSHPTHVRPALPEDFVGAYRRVNRREEGFMPALHTGVVAADGRFTMGMPFGRIDGCSADGATPARAWSIGTVTPLTTPALYAGRLLAGSADYRLHAIADNGLPIWSFATGGRVYSAPVPVGDDVCFGSDDGFLYKVDVDSGILIWQYQTGGRIRSAPAIDGGRVLAASWDGFLHAVDLESGALVWKAPIAPLSSSSPAVANGRVYVGDEAGRLHAFDAAGGRPVWSHALGAAIGICPVVTPEGIFVCSEDGRAALVGLDGTPVWTRPLFADAPITERLPIRVTGQPFATRSQLVVATTQGVRVLTRQDGLPDARFTTDFAGWCVDAAPYGSRLCLVESRTRLSGGLQRYVVDHGGAALVLEPSGEKQ